MGRWVGAQQVKFWGAYSAGTVESLKVPRRSTQGRAPAIGSHRMLVVWLSPRDSKQHGTERVESESRASLEGCAAFACEQEHK